MPSLRHIAIHVEEPKRGHFEWVLTERIGRNWRALDRSTSPVETYKAAMAAGLVALQNMVEDLDVGPRTGRTSALVESKDERHEPQKKVPASAIEAAPSKPYFGFGPVR